MSIFFFIQGALDNPQKHKLKVHKTLFIHTILFSIQIVLKSSAEHDSDAIIFCAKFQNNQAIRI